MNKKEKYVRAALSRRLALHGQEGYHKAFDSYKNDLSSFPKFLYKYRSFDRFTRDMIENKYIYLSPLDELDDQFEGLAGLKQDVQNDSEKLKKKFLEAIADLVPLYLTTSYSRRKIKKIVKEYIESDQEISLEEKNRMYQSNNDNDIIKLFLSLAASIWKENKFQESLKELIEKSIELRSKIGVGSLSEAKSSQVMWEMYANHYKGYCIEYETSGLINIEINTFPIIYRNRKSSDILKILINIILEELFYNLTQGNFSRSYCGLELYQLILTKYDDWKFQKEWRIVGERSFKFNGLRISAIYLGKNCPKKNKNMIIGLSKKHGFSVYEQIDNLENLTLDFVKIK